MDVDIDQARQQRFAGPFNLERTQAFGIGRSACVDLRDLARLDQNASPFNHRPRRGEHTGILDQHGLPARQRTLDRLGLGEILLAL